MVKFEIEKKLLAEATAILNQVANLRSVGASPSESSGIMLTPTTLSLINMNEANGLVVNNIPIMNVEGDISQHLDSTYMVNTKKLDSIVRGSGQLVIFSISDEKVAIGEGRRRYDLSMFKVERQSVPELRLLNRKVNIKTLLKNMMDSAEITANSANLGDMAGTLFTGSSLLSTDRISVLHIGDGGVLTAEDQVQDLTMVTDLFAACLPKTSETEAVPGFTADGKRFVLCFGNMLLFKTLRVEGFPKDRVVKGLKRIAESAEGHSSHPIVRAKIQVAEYKERLNELRAIVEAEDYVLHYAPGGEQMIQLSNSNLKSGADGCVSVQATVMVPEGLGDCAAKFSFLHLEMLGTIFGDCAEVELFSEMEGEPGKRQMRYIAVKAADRTYFAVPKAI